MAVLPNPLPLEEEEEVLVEDVPVEPPPDKQSRRDRKNARRAKGKGSGDTDSRTRKNNRRNKAKALSTSRTTVFQHDQSKETNLNEDGVTPQNSATDKANQTIHSPNSAEEETIAIQVSENGALGTRDTLTSESILNKALSGKDITEDLTAIVNMSVNKDSSIYETEVFGHAYGPFQLFDRYTDDKSQRLHGKPVSETSRMEQYQTARAHYDEGGWLYWNAYTNGSYKKFMSNGDNPISDEQLTVLYNMPEDEVAYLRDELFSDDWETARAVLIAESGNQLVKGVDNIITQGSKTVIKQDKVEAKIKEIPPPITVDENPETPFSDPEEIKYYYDEDGEIVEMTNFTTDFQKRLIRGVDMIYRHGDDADKLFAEHASMSNIDEEHLKFIKSYGFDHEFFNTYSKKELATMYAGWEWVQTGDFKQWWDSKNSAEKGVFKGWFEGSLAQNLMDPYAKHIFNHALTFAYPEGVPESDFIENVVAPLTSFMNPIDWLAFKYLSMFGGTIMKTPMQKMYTKLLNQGVGPRVAKKIIKDSWLQNVSRISSLTTALGGFNGIHYLNESLQASDIKGNEFSTGQLLFEISKGAGTAIFGGSLGISTGKITKEIHKFLNKRGVVQPPNWSPTVSDFAGEVLGFTVAHKATGNPDKLIDVEAVKSMILDPDTKFAQPFAETAVYLLALRGMTNFSTRKQQPGRGDRVIEKYTPKQVTTMLRDKVIKKLAEVEGVTYEDMKGRALQMELGLEDLPTIKRITEKDVSNIINEVAKEMGIEGEIPLKTVYDAIKTEVENNPANKLHLIEKAEIEETLNKSTRNNKSTTEATGDLFSSTQPAKKRRAQDKKNLNKDIKKKPEEWVVDLDKKRKDRTIHDVVRDGIESLNLDRFTGGLNKLSFRKGGKPATKTQMARDVAHQVKSVISDIKLQRQNRRGGLNSIITMEAFSAKDPKHKKSLAFNKAKRLENKLYNHYERVLIESAKPTHGGKPNAKSIKHHLKEIDRVNKEIGKIQKDLKFSGFDPLKIEGGFAGGAKGTSKRKNIDANNKKNKAIQVQEIVGPRPPAPLKRHQILHTTVAEDANTAKVKRAMKTSDGSEGWGARVNYLKPYNSKFEAQMASRKIMGDNYLGSWSQHSTQLFKVDGKWHFRIHRGNLKVADEISLGQVGASRMMSKERWQALQSSETSNTPNHPERIKSRSLRMGSEVRLQTIDDNLVNLNITANSSRDRIKAWELKVKALDLAKKEKGFENAVDKRNRILLTKGINQEKASIKLVEKQQRQHIRERENIKEVVDQIREAEAKAQAIRDLKDVNLGMGALGYFDKTTWKLMGKNIKEQSYHLKENLKALWRKAPHVMRMTSEKFSEWLSDQGMNDPDVLRLINKKENFKDLQNEAMLENTIDVSEKLNKGTSDYRNGDNGELINTRNVDRKNVEYFGADALHHYKDPIQHEIIAKFYKSLGQVFDADMRRLGTTMEEIRYDSRKAGNQKLVAEIVLSGEIKVVNGENKYVNPSQSLKTSEQYMLVRDNIATLADLYVSSKGDPTVLDMLAKHVFVNVQMRSEWGRLGATMKESPQVNKEALQKLGQKLSEIDSKHGIEGDKLLQSLYSELVVSDLKAKPANEALFSWKVAEIGRNFKLASPSSYAKSVVGNTISGIMEFMTKASTPALSYLVDPTRKYSGVTLRGSTRDAMRQFEASFGLANMINPRITGEKALNMYGLIKTKSIMYESLWGEKGAFKAGLKLLAEDPQAMIDNPYLYNEGFSKHLGKRTLGDIVESPTLQKVFKQFGWSTEGMSDTQKGIPVGLGTFRVFQNLHGALDMWWRIPTTMVRFEELVTRTAVHELRKEGIKIPTAKEIMRREGIIKEDGDAVARLTADAKEYARFVVFQEQMHSGFAKHLNSMRTKQDKSWSGWVNWQAPFVVTYANGLKKLAEYSPAGMVMWKGRDAWARAGLFGTQARVNRLKSSAKIAPDRDALAEVMARTTVGSALWTTLATLLTSYDDGKLWGDFGGLSTENRDMNNSQGYQENSITIGDTNYSFGGFAQPLSDMMQVVVEYQKNPGDPYATDAMVKAMDAFGTMVLNNPIATGPSDLVKVFNGYKTPEWMFIKHTLGTFIPTLVKQLQAIDDPTMRRRNRQESVLEQIGPSNLIGDWFFNVDGGIVAKEFDQRIFIEELNAQILAPIGNLLPRNWVEGTGPDGNIDPRYAVVDLLGYPVKKSKSWSNLVGVRSLAVDATPVQKEYSRLFTEFGEQLHYPKGVFEDEDHRIEIDPTTLHLIHATTGLLFRQAMEIVIPGKSYQSIISGSTLKSLTEQELNTMSVEDIKSEKTMREASAEFAQEHLAREVWRDMHNTIKETVNSVYLLKFHDISHIANISDSFNRVADILELPPSAKNMSSQDELNAHLDNLWKTLENNLTSVVFEQAKGQYTERAMNARRDLATAFEYINKSKDVNGDYEMHAMALIGKYSNETFGVREAILAVTSMMKKINPQINLPLDDIETQDELRKIVRKVATQGAE